MQAAMAEGRSCGEVGRAYRSERGTAIHGELAKVTEGWASAVAWVEKEMRRRRDLRADDSVWRSLLSLCCWWFACRRCRRIWRERRERSQG